MKTSYFVATRKEQQAFVSITSKPAALFLALAGRVLVFHSLSG